MQPRRLNAMFMPSDKQVYSWLYITAYKLLIVFLRSTFLRSVVMATLRSYFRLKCYIPSPTTSMPPATRLLSAKTEENVSYLGHLQARWWAGHSDAEAR